MNPYLLEDSPFDIIPDGNDVLIMASTIMTAHKLLLEDRMQDAIELLGAATKCLSMAGFDTSPLDS